MRCKIPFQGETNGLNDMRPFVEHHTFGPSAHGSVGHLRPRRGSFLRQRLKHLGRPDDGNMRGLARTIRFPLAPQPCARSRALPPSRHAPPSPPRGACVNRRGGDAGDSQTPTEFDLEHHANLLRPTRGKLLLELTDILRSADERKTNHVRRLGGKIEILPVFERQRGEARARCPEG